MKKLRHPIRSIREPFGKAGLTVAILALVMAMVGGAYAAGGLTKSQEKQVKKIAKKYAGKPGPAGANGTNGAQGPKGDPGAPGSNGTNGTNGAPGESVTITPEGECTKFSNGTGTGEACNGTTGFTATLPSGETETGSFYAPQIGEAFEPGKFPASAAISFNIPLAAGLSAAHYVTKAEWEGGTGPSQCLNGTAEEPEAQEGNLCVFEGPLSSPVGGVVTAESGSFKAGSFAPGAGRTGSLLALVVSSSGSRYVGTWAVTAP